MAEFKRYLDSKNTKAVVIMKLYNRNSIGYMIYTDFIPYYFDLDKTKLEALSVFRKFLESKYKKELVNYLLSDKSILYYDYEEGSGDDPEEYIVAEECGISLDPMFEITFEDYRCYVMDKSKFENRELKLFENWGQILIEPAPFEHHITIITESDIRNVVKNYICDDLANMIAEYTGNLWSYGKTNFIVYSRCGDIMKFCNENPGDNDIYDIDFYDGYCCFDLLDRGTIRTEFKELNLRTVRNNQRNVQSLIYITTDKDITFGQDALLEVINLEDFSVSW
jgi:hypothetical protein